MLHTSPTRSLTSRHSHGRAFLQRSLEGLEPEDFLQRFPDPALQARGSLPAHPKDAANGDRNLSESRSLPPSSARGLPRPTATCTSSPATALPPSPFFRVSQGRLSRPPQWRGAQHVYSGSAPSPWGTAEGAHSEGGLAAHQTRSHPTWRGSMGAGGSFSSAPHSFPGGLCPPTAHHVPRPTSAPARPGPHPPHSLHTRQVLSWRHKTTSQASIKGPARSLFIPSPLHHSIPRRSAPPR